MPISPTYLWPLKYINSRHFLDQEMDGMAIIQTFGSISGPDCLRDVLHKFGTRVKVYTAIKSYLDKSLMIEVLVNFSVVLFAIVTFCINRIILDKLLQLAL